MRIVQIIDSLEIGGAEKMAVNYANALSEKIEFSGIVVTRHEGNLKRQINPKVSYLYLRKQSALDIKAVFRLKKYCQVNSVSIIQPHSSSFFIAVLLKFIYPKIKIVWHDHNGLSEFISVQKSFVLKLASFLFDGIIAVNYKLKVWAEKELNCGNVIYLPNFTNELINQNHETQLQGTDGKRILCLANLRDQKNHDFLLAIAQLLKGKYSDWTFHLVGKDFNDAYSEKLKHKIFTNQLENNVFLYGSKNDVTHIINQSDIAILTSKSEGLPLALIEYGLAKKPVIATNVGEVPFVIDNGVNGFVVTVDDVDGFYQNLVKLIEDKKMRAEFGTKIFVTIMNDHSEKGVVSNYLNWLTER